MTSINASETQARRTSTILICFLAHNLSMGLAYRTFGPLLTANQEHFGIDRAAAAFGMSLVTLTIGGLAPIAAKLLGRISTPSAMMAGALLGAAGFGGLALTSSYTVALGMYALIGASASICGVLGPLNIISGMPERGRGLMLSLVNLPLILFLSPFIVGMMVPQIGRTPVLLGVAACVACIAPLCLLLPSEVSGRGAVIRADQPAAPGLLRSPPFWLMSLGVGLVTGAGISFIVHIVPYGLGAGFSLQSASGLLSVYSGAGLLGILAFGWLIDRIGAIPAIIFSAASQGLLWFAIGQASGAELYGVTILFGICNVPVIALHGAACTALFGPAGTSRAMGLSYGVKLPFIFGVPPLVGLLFERSGGYALPFMMCGALLATAAMLFAAIMFARRPLAVAAPAAVEEIA